MDKDEHITLNTHVCVCVCVYSFYCHLFFFSQFHLLHFTVLRPKGKKMERLCSPHDYVVTESKICK